MHNPEQPENFVKKKWGLSIRNRLLIILIATTTSSLLIATLVLAWLDILMSHENIRTNLQLQSNVVAASLGRATQSGDAEAATNILRALDENPEVKHAYVYLPSGSVLGSYSRSASEFSPVPIVMGGDHEILTPIYRRGQIVGKLSIVGDSERMVDRLFNTSLSTVGILFLALGLGLVVSLPLQGQLIQPIRNLISLTDRVREERNYGLRAAAGHGTEYDELAKGLNSMLDQIQQRDETLEERVGLQTDAIRNEFLIFSAAISAVPSGLVLYEIESGEVKRSNKALHDLFQFDERPANISVVFNALGQQDKKLIRDLKLGSPVRAVDISIAQHNTLALRVQLSNILLDNGRQCLLVIHDHTKLVAAAEALHEEKELAHTTLDSIADGVVSTTDTGKIKYMNPIAQRLLVGDGKAVNNVDISKVYRPLELDGKKAARCPVVECIRTKEIIESENVSLFFARSGEEAIVEHTVTPMFDMHNNLIGTTLVFRDVTQIRKLIHRISHQATHDELTELINRREFEFRLKQVIDRAEVDLTQFAILYIDLDRFKVVNDSCGHLVGDMMLKEVAKTMRQCVRKGDALARLGGDEFGLILENCGREMACSVADKILQYMQKMEFEWEGEKYVVSASIGLVPVTYEGESANVLLSLADAACYSAKDAGRNQVYVYEAGDPEISDRFGQARWVARIRRAIEDNRFFLVRQNIVPLNDDAGEPHYEILLRMRDIDGSILPPNEYLPAAEHFDLMGLIDRWVVTRTLEHMGQNREDSSTYAINLSGITLNDENFSADVQQLLVENDISAERLCFEVTETAAVANLGGARALIESLKELGCKFSLDDFGTGMSSFAYLRTLPVDYLKIDGLFIQNMHENLVDYAMVRSIHELGRVLNIKTVAEWVEEESTVDMLKEIGVDFGQGWHLGKIEKLDGTLL